MVAHLFANQDSRNGSTCKKGRGLSIGKSKGGRQKYLFRQDLLFLPGKAAATDLQQTERPLALETSVRLRESGVSKRVPLRTSVRRILSSAAVHRFSHRVFLAQVASKAGADSVGAFIEAIGGEGERWTAVERKEGGLSTGHQGMRTGDHMCSFSRSKLSAP